MIDEDPAGGPREDQGGKAPGADPSAAEAFQRRAEAAEERLAEVLAAYRQVKIDNEGYRDRITRNLERRFDQRRERLLLKFINILDNMDRALAAAEQSYAGNPLIEGLILVRTQLLQTLQEEGLERIPVIGLPYDPNHSEAVETRSVSEPEHHHVVVKELLRGYRLNGKVARVSRVIVGEYGGVAPEAEAPPGQLIGGDEAQAAPPSLEAPEVDREHTLEEIIERAERESEGERKREPPRVRKPMDPLAETTPLDEEMLRQLFEAPPPEPEK